MKPVVRYRPSVYKIEVSYPTLVYPIDHPNPDYVSNGGHLAITSPVIALREDGFETENTIYVEDKGHEQGKEP